jgi:hypothetical protein
MYNVISTWKEDKEHTELTRISRRAIRCPHCNGFLVIELTSQEKISLDGALGKTPTDTPKKFREVGRGEV